MYSLTKVFLEFVLLSAFFKTHVSIPITTNQDDNTAGRSECKLVKDCDFYLQFMENDVPGLSKEAMNKELKRQECDLNIHGKLEEGNSNLFTLLLMNKSAKIKY